MGLVVMERVISVVVLVLDLGAVLYVERIVIYS